MKSRLSYFFISVIIIILFLIGVFIWRDKRIYKIPSVKEKSYTAPISSTYVPKNADLVFHWKINPNSLPKYIENYQKRINKNITNKKIKSIRDTSFKLLNLDFTKDIANWSGGIGSFAIFNTKNQLISDWLLVLEMKKNVNINEELKSISDQIISDKNTDSDYKLNSSDSHLITKKINSNQSIYFLIQKENVLISSNPNIIKSSLIQKNSNRFNKKENYTNIKIKDNIHDGILLLEMSPKKIFNLIGQDKDLLEINQAEKLISTLNLDKEKLLFEGILTYNIKNKRSINDLAYDLKGITEVDLFENFILIDDPEKYFGEKSNDPYKKLIKSVVQKSMKSDYSRLFKIILENTKGALIWLKEKEWVAITKKISTEKNNISNSLRKEKFLPYNLNFNKKNLEIWSKITTNNNENYEIKENIEAIIEENKDEFIWSQDLSSISNFDNKKYSANNLDIDHRENQNHDFEDIIRIHLGKEKTKVFLNNFYPYILLSTMLGNKLDLPQSMDISISIPTINYPDFVKFEISLKTS